MRCRRPVGTALLHEDAEIRVWENRLPGTFDGPLHTHDADYWLLTGQNSDPNGRVGDVLYVRNGYKEVASNAKEHEMVFYLVELKRTQPPSPEAAGPGWGRDGRLQPDAPASTAVQLPPAAAAAASAEVLFENVQLRLWDMRVSAAATGTVPVDATSPSVFVTDVRGKRAGALDVLELGSLDSHASGNLANTKNYGTTYHSAAAAGMVRGEAVNEGSDELRCIVLEIKQQDRPRL